MNFAASSPGISAPRPKPLPEPGFGIAIINEREGLGDGFSKLPLLRALKRAYPGEAITWIVSEGDSPYRVVMAEIARPYVERVLIDTHMRSPTLGAIRRLRHLPRFSLVIDHRTDLVTISTARLNLRTRLYRPRAPATSSAADGRRGRGPSTSCASSWGCSRR